MLISKKEEFVEPLSPLTEEQENILEKKMVWVLGTASSGSTWLARKLLQHELNAVWNEPCIGRIFQYTKDFERSSSPAVEFFFANKFKNNFWLPILRKLIINRAYYQSCSLDKNIIIKEPGGGGGADILMECLPNSKMIFLLRDGRDVVDSRVARKILRAQQKNKQNENLNSEMINPFPNKKSRIRKIERVSKVWNLYISVVVNAYENHNPDLRLLVRYEDLRENTFPELKKIYDFIGIKINDEDLKRKIDEFSYDNIPDKHKGPGHRIRTAKHGGYIDNFSADEIELMTSIMSDTLKKMGYQT